MVSMAPTPLILNPTFNHPIEITLERTIRTPTSVGEVSTVVLTTTGVASIWVEIGWKEKETKEGRDLMELAEVAIPSDDNPDMRPGSDYVVRNGVRYKVIEVFNKSRMTGMTTYQVGRVVT